MTCPDAVMLSFDEPLADTLHARLERVLGRPVKRLHGVRGMRRAYRLCAELADSDEFLLVDGDFAIDTGFAAAEVHPPEGWRVDAGVACGQPGQRSRLRVRRAEVSPPQRAARDGPGHRRARRASRAPEFCLTVAGTTRFNQTPYHAWKAGFRECAMLARGSEYGMAEGDTQERIAAWTASSGREFASFTAVGARDGIAFTREAADDPQRFEVLNDSAWLRAYFTAHHGGQVATG